MVARPTIPIPGLLTGPEQLVVAGRAGVRLAFIAALQRRRCPPTDREPVTAGVLRTGAYPNAELAVAESETRGG